MKSLFYYDFVYDKSLFVLAQNNLIVYVDTLIASVLFRF